LEKLQVKPLRGLWKNLTIQLRKIKPFRLKSNEINPYRLINNIFFIILCGIFIYSAIFSPVRGNYPIQSSHKFITGDNTLSTGLSRGFSCILRFRFEEASLYNQYSLQVFTFFLIQFIFRSGVLVAGFFIPVRRIQRIIILDAILSGMIFIACFWPFIIDLFRI
jgi:hypothetical protein